MSETSKSNFLNNVEDMISNVLNNKDFLVIKTQEGNVVMLTEEEYEFLVMNAKNIQYKRAGD